VNCHKGAPIWQPHTNKDKQGMIMKELFCAAPYSVFIMGIADIRLWDEKESKNRSVKKKSRRVESEDVRAVPREVKKEFWLSLKRPSGPCSQAIWPACLMKEPPARAGQVSENQVWWTLDIWCFLLRSSVLFSSVSRDPVEVKITYLECCACQHGGVCHLQSWLSSN